MLLWNVEAVMKKNFRLSCTLLMVILLANSCVVFPSSSNEDNLRDNINISGAFAIYPLMTRWAEEFQRINPGVSFDIASIGAEKGMTDVLASKVDIGMVSREVSGEEKAKGAYQIPIGKDAVFVLISENNPVLSDLLEKGVTKDALEKIFITGVIRTWGEVIGNESIKDEIHVYTRADFCGAGATWGLFLGGTQDDLLGEKKFGDPGIIQALQNDPLGIGYNNLIYAFGLEDVASPGTVILPMDLNNNGKADVNEIFNTRTEATSAVASGLYPAPPSRYLYLVTNGKPDGIIQAFLEWILTDGQIYVNQLGYVQLPNEQLEQALQSVR